MVLGRSRTWWPPSLLETVDATEEGTYFGAGTSSWSVRSLLGNPGMARPPWHAVGHSSQRLTSQMGEPCPDQLSCFPTLLVRQVDSLS